MEDERRKTRIGSSKTRIGSSKTTTRSSKTRIGMGLGLGWDWDGIGIGLGLVLDWDGIGPLRIRCQEVQFKTSLPHTPGVRMTVVYTNSLK